MAIVVDGAILPFMPEIQAIRLEPGEHLDDLASYFRFRQRSLGDRTFPQTLQGKDYEIWAMARYPSQENIIWSRFNLLQKWFSPFFDPNATTDKLSKLVQAEYQSFIDYYPDLAGERPIGLGWYTRGGRFRVVTRPYRPEGEQHALSVATTLPIRIIEYKAK